MTLDIDNIFFSGKVIKMRKISLIFLILFLGCQSIPLKEEKKAELELSSLSRFEDIPVPQNFVYLPLKSFVFERNKVRIGILKYVGVSTPEAIVNFLKRNMSNYGWKLRSVIEGGAIFLNFQKEKETCIVNVEYIKRKIFLTFALSPVERETPSSD